MMKGHIARRAKRNSGSFEGDTIAACVGRYSVLTAPCLKEEGGAVVSRAMSRHAPTMTGDQASLDYAEGFILDLS